ncbi:protein kinase domain-containing protein [Sorangium sp. So ce1335]|uniref:serine/threonine-protein kinase n=1 Tax=Sorangium sp. So ce1335 TaxID=3133335 RepID=UPI003F5DBA1E
MFEVAPGITIAGRYRVERALAQGAMGSVWVGRHLLLDVDIAIKFMAPQFATSAELRTRFEREARAAAMLKSAHAVQVYDYGIEQDTPYIVMELLEGEDLSARLARERRLGLPAMLGILDQVGRALRRAHELGLVHRDLKPGNIFLSLQDGEQVAKVVDFGVAKAVDVAASVQTTRPGALLGSPSYMSPEQVRSSSRVDHRSDLWSLGVIAFECLTGQLPFPGQDLGDVLVEICTAPIPLASQLAPGLGPEVDAFFARALERDPARRFQSATELVEAFAALPGAREPGAGAWGPAADAGAAQGAPAGGTVRISATEAARISAPEPAPGWISATQAAPARISAPTPGRLSATEAAPARISATEPANAPAAPFQPGTATFSPSSQTRADAVLPQKRGRTGLVVGAAVGLVVVLGGVLLLFAALSGPADVAGAVPPAASVGGAAPAASVGEAAPAASGGEAAPAASIGEAAPAASIGEAAPAASIGEAAPGASAADAAPAESASERGAAPLPDAGLSADVPPGDPAAPTAPPRTRAPGKAGGKAPSNTRDDLLNEM